MVISDYFKQYVDTIFNGNQAAVARAFGIHRSVICHILQGKRGLTPKLAQKAEELSGGRFKKEDFIWPKEEQLNNQNTTGKAQNLKKTELKANKKIDVNQDLNDKIDVQQKNKDLTENDHKHKYHNCQPGFTNQYNLKSDLLGNLNTEKNNAVNIGNSAENTNNLKHKNSAEVDGLADKSAEIATLPTTDVAHRISNSKKLNETGGVSGFYLNGKDVPFTADFAGSHSSNSDIKQITNTELNNKQVNNSYFAENAENAETTNKNISRLNKHNKDLPITVTASKDGLSLNINLNLQGLADLNSKN